MPPDCLACWYVLLHSDTHVNGTAERERERKREKERERESVAILAQVLHLCLGACDASLHRGGGAGLPWGCAPEGAPVAFPSGA